MIQASRKITIAGRDIGQDYPPFIIAELSANHNGSLEQALEIVEAAHRAGADAIKLQTYTADTITLDHDGPEFRIEGGPWDGYTLHDLYGEASTPWEWHKPLFERARGLGMIPFSSPFDPTAVDFLADLDAPAYKIASFEVVDLPLIAKAARKGRPMIISSGLASKSEIREAVDVALANGADGVSVLHCISAYPALAREAHLKTIRDLADSLPIVPGFSDHTLGITVAIAAVAAGACVIEKHLTLRRADGGPDSEFSVEPQEMAELVRSCRSAWEALGSVDYGLKDGEKPNIQFRRSLYVVKDIAAGETLTEANIRSIRPGFGLAPKYFDQVLGKRAAVQLASGTALRWDHIA